jgi:hypothetical protein
MKLHGKIPKKLELGEVTTRILELSEEALAACDELHEDALAAGNAKHALEKKKALTLPKYQNSAKSAASREALAFPEYADEHEAYEQADSIKTASIERVRTLRQVLSALQTIANSERQVASLLQYHDNSA